MFLLIILCLLTQAPNNVGWAASAKGFSAQTVSFQTTDGWKIAAVYKAPTKGKPVLILVHGVASQKSEWDRLTKELGRIGLGTLALDLRGHGESLEGPRGRTNFRSFKMEGGDWSDATKDVAAAILYLRKKLGLKVSIAIMGASIGANLASQAAASNPGRVAWVALLSPGHNYRGVAVAPQATPRALLAASPYDSYAFNTAQHLLMTSYPNAAFLQAKGGHGAQMFEDAEFLKKFIEWIKKNLKQ